MRKNNLKTIGADSKVGRRIPTNGLIFGLLLFSALSFSTLSAAQMENASEGLAADVVNHLLNSPKVKKADAVLKDFLEEGATTTRVIVNLREAETIGAERNLERPNNREQLANRIHDLLIRVLPGLNPAQVQKARPFKYMAGFSAQVTPEGLEALVEDADVISIEEDRLLHPNLAQGIPLMNASAARSTYSGEGLSVAICDTGIDYNHPALGNGGFPNSKVIGGYDTGDNDNDPMDMQGHGTACAGISAGNLGNQGDYIGGVAWGARLYALKISQGSGGSAYLSDMIEAWEWCITHQYDDPNHPILIINTSFGGGRYTETCDADSLAMTTAAANAKAAGMTLFVSSGNDGYCDAIGWPACISHVVSVGAVYDAHFTADSIGWCVQQQSCSDKIPTFGCESRFYSPDVPYEDQVAVYSNTASFLSLLAPSNWATTTALGGGYWTSAYGFGGTSAASPYATGAAACLQSAAKAITGAFLTPDQLQTTLMNTGDSITDTKVVITKPRINLGNAVAALGGGGSFVYVEPSGTCGGNSPCYTRIQDGINAAASGNTIKISEDANAQMLSLNTAKSVTLQGGWNPSFTVQTSLTTITSLSIQKGSVAVESLVLQ
ncbi:MAG: S8 family serine peptidase [Deltaproteobacteria bacterium]|nr:S8 family serine peptidase [Deltaproteobacteria bacterium]